ncbi:PqiC family protein [Brucella thiophenivorans]|uniref:ABC-type transport auxiliary lipoprotein component domain-containing protein n=1 Tax=Brucella thiophenivorans TaxID=571255 RepID=A0A256F5Y1_9HYPH|nr:PqiC family protein [Brucella thiophenivorans]OYR10267.1 hypothetical protein CEV31_3878 [Brucella thiophenivorans]
MSLFSLSLLGRSAGFLVMILLAACASPNAKVYMLAVQKGQHAQGRPISLSIETVDIAKYLDRPQLVRRSDDVQLGVSELERWGEPLSSMVQRVLAENLRQRLPEGSLVTTSQNVTGKEAGTLELSVTRFDADATGAVVLIAQWQVHYRRKGASGAMHANITVWPLDGSTRAQVKAMSDALDQLSVRVVAGLRG